MTWTAPFRSPTDGPMTGAAMLEAVLVWHRSTLLNICARLTAEQLALRPVPASNLSLLGLMRHLTKVERIWFCQRARGLPVQPMYDEALGEDADFEDIRPDDAQDAVQRLVGVVDECLRPTRRCRSRLRPRRGGARSSSRCAWSTCT